MFCVFGVSVFVYGTGNLYSNPTSSNPYALSPKLGNPQAESLHQPTAALGWRLGFSVGGLGFRFGLRVLGLGLGGLGLAL